MVQVTANAMGSDAQAEQTANLLCGFLTRGDDLETVKEQKKSLITTGAFWDKGTMRTL